MSHFEHLSSVHLQHWQQKLEYTVLQKQNKMFQVNQNKTLNQAGTYINAQQQQVCSNSKIVITAK